MQRCETEGRNDWERTVEYDGFVFHSLDGPYWNEQRYYSFSTAEVNEISNASARLHRMCLEAVDYVVEQGLLARFCIAEQFHQLIIDSWRDGERALYGRFDLRFDGVEPPKLFEYNADTPTSLLEAGRVQNRWCRTLFPDRMQFNRIEELLLRGWRSIAKESPVMHFSSVAEHTEDRCNVEYMRSIAARAGIETHFLNVEELRWDSAAKLFRGKNDERIDAWFKLYPWEWILEDTYGAYMNLRPMRCFEPPWKLLLSSKAILPILWELFPGHPNLLPAYWSPEKLGERYVRKPIYGREGANISIVSPTHAAYVPGPYGKEPCIYQGFSPLPKFGSMHTLIGSWVIDGEPAGIGVRESRTLISENRSHFLPHTVH